jgi:hypothetical protein
VYFKPFGGFAGPSWIGMWGIRLKEKETLTCPECDEGRNLNEDQTRCWDCDPEGVDK